jgi:pimeloyl-ACP methyl ester carboxylesterase
MDGTGQLYSRLMKALPKAWRMTVLAYPTDAIEGYGELLQRVQLQVPEHPFVLVAESYSVPLAIRLAATHPEHLKGVVLCAGFASSPVVGWKRLAARLIDPVLFRLPLSGWVLQRFLIGEGADRALMDGVRSAISSVLPSVLEARLREILDCDVLADLPQVDVPLLNLQASRDRLVRDESLTAMRRNRDDLIVQKIDGPHLLFQREPEQSANAIERFIRNL